MGIAGAAPQIKLLDRGRKRSAPASAEWLVGLFCSKADAPFSKNSFCRR